MSTVQILGMAPNIEATPRIPEAERWCSGSPRSYRIKWPEAKETWTRWFNFHTLYHIYHKYPYSHVWLGTHKDSRPIYLQEVDPNIPNSIRFPRELLQKEFSIDGTPFRYFTCSATWQIAFAIHERFNRIELWGFELKRDRQYDFERPCFFYWVERARKLGIEVYLPPEVEVTPPGDPTTYNGPLYGYEIHNEIYAKTFAKPEG